jgi:hypothetical protein
VLAVRGARATARGRELMRALRAAAWLLAIVGATLARSSAAQDAATPEDAALVLRLGDAATKDAAADALVARGAAAAPAVVAGLGDARTRTAAIEVVARLGPAAKAAVPTLANFARNPLHSSRVPAARALGLIGAEAGASLPMLAAWVADAKAASRADVALAIERILVDAARVAAAGAKHGPSRVRTAIDAGCDWLLRHQAADGGWSGDGFAKSCRGAACGGLGDPAHHVGLTGLATLALLGAGDDSGPRRAAALRGADWIASVQDKEGFLGSRRSNHACYDQLIGGLALAETMRVAAQPSLRVSVEGAVAMAQRMRSTATGGWRYELDSTGDSDTSVTVWAVKFLKAAQSAGVAVDAAALQGGLRWIEGLTESEFGRTGYQQHGGPPARKNECVERFPADQVETLTACAIEVRLSVGRTRHDDELLQKGLALLAKKPPRWAGVGSAVDMYYWYHGSTVERAVGGADYVAWRKMLVEALLPHQGAGADSCARGSWAPVDPWSDDGGRIYATALPLLALEACAEDPAERPALPGDRSRVVVAALEKGATGGDAASRLAILHALDAVRDAYR